MLISALGRSSGEGIGNIFSGFSILLIHLEITRNYKCKNSARTSVFISHFRVGCHHPDYIQTRTFLRRPQHQEVLADSLLPSHPVFSIVPMTFIRATLSRGMYCIQSSGLFSVRHSKPVFHQWVESFLSVYVYRILMYTLIILQFYLPVIPGVKTKQNNTPLFFQCLPFNLDTLEDHWPNILQNVPV